jgi:hypothetical protein
MSDRPGVTGAIAIIYCLYGVSLLVVIGLGDSALGMPPSWADAVIPVLLIVTGVGVLRRTRWGRWLGYFVSLPLLLGVPIGTLLGGYMIWHLTQYRRHFADARGFS